MDRGTLVLGISQSGETADTLAALRLAREKARAVLAVTNNPRSSMAREADGVLDLHAGPEIGVAATKTFVGQMAALALFALAFAQARGALSEEESRALVQELQRVPLKMDRVLGGAAGDRAGRPPLPRLRALPLPRPLDQLPHRPRRGPEAQGDLLHPRRGLRRRAR